MNKEMKRTRWLFPLLAALIILTLVAVGCGKTTKTTQYTLTMAVDGSGSTTPAVGAHTYSSGDNVSITATANSSWHFTGWSGGVGDATSASTWVIMNDNETVTASFSENTTATQQWAAYAFDQTVTPASGVSGKMKTFTIDATYSDNSQVREFNIEGTYLGTENVQIDTQKMVVNQSTYETTTTNVTTSIECYKVEHRITVLRDDVNESLPNWADITVWIPTDNFQTTASYFWIYPKATYIDSDNNTGSWSYYLTQDMQNEMNNPPAGTAVYYAPVVQGDFYGYDGWAFYGLYGWGWSWFKAYAEGGSQYLQEGSASIGGYSYSVTKSTKTVGGYSFDVWTVTVTVSGAGEYSATISPDLPLPLHLKVASTAAGNSSYFEYTLTGLQLQ